jgi:undecaprenyl diphosphate synthase
VDAAAKLAGRIASGEVAAEGIDEAAFHDCLYDPSLPDPDLLIRTSGELRVSNFLLWQIAYAEIWVTDVLWPDFTEADLIEGIRAYQSRDRRYGLHA